MSNEYEVEIIALYPLDKTKRKTASLDDAPRREPVYVSSKPQMKSWREPSPDEIAESQAALSGDEWLTPEGGFYRRGDSFKISKDDCYRIYDAIWRNMDRENNLINQRISWSILLTAGFLTAQTFVLSRVLEVLSAERQSSLTPATYSLMVGAFGLCALLSFIAGIFSRQTKHGVDAAQRQLMYLKRRYFRLKVGRKSLFQDVMRLPRPFGNSDDHLSGNIVSQRFPFVMMFVWYLFFIVEVIGGVLIYYFYI